MTKPHRSIGILQPVFLPWLGYFEQMKKVDHFVFQDDVQYTSRDWRNRNRIKTARGPLWLTVPIVRQSLSTQIDEMEISYRRPWAAKMTKSIKQNYARAPNVGPVSDHLANEIRQAPTRLVDLPVLFAWLKHVKPLGSKKCGSSNFLLDTSLVIQYL